MRVLSILFPFETCRQCLFLKTTRCVRLASKSCNYTVTEAKKPVSTPFMGPGSRFCTFVRDVCVVPDPDCFQSETLWAALLCAGRWEEPMCHLIVGEGGEFSLQPPARFVLVECRKCQFRAGINVVLKHAL